MGNSVIAFANPIVTPSPMALIKCKECGHQISSSSENCPSCGNPHKKKAARQRRWVLLLVLSFCIWLGNALQPSKPKDEQPAASGTVASVRRTPPPDVGTAAEAWVMAQDFVKDSLVAPSTAKWGDWGEQRASTNVTSFGDGTFLVEGFVDSQNRFGATVRTNFVAKLRYKGNRRWALTEPLTMRPR